MSAEAFIDTNVFVYHLDGTDRRKHRIAEGIVRDALANGSGCISFQVVQECLNTALRKAAVPLAPDQARDYLDVVLLPLMQVAPSPALYHRALDVQQRWRFGFYDSLVVAAALGAGCTRLLSENLQQGQRIDTLVVQNPFAA
jgi:predicted nucleic acid-binding protein